MALAINRSYVLIRILHIILMFVDLYLFYSVATHGHRPSGYINHQTLNQSALVGQGRAHVGQGDGCAWWSGSPSLAGLVFPWPRHHEQTCAREKEGFDLF
jgi:hypothetical protein